MKSVTVDQNGKVFIDEVKTPEIRTNGILVKTHYSLISSGTESKLIKKRRENPLDKKDRFQLGYSNAGEVIQVGNKCLCTKVGDRVACGGWAVAVHAEKVSVPKNLLSVIPENVEYKEAAFTTIACVCLQAVRRCKVQLGDTVALLGQGLVGQLCNQFAKISGARTIVSAKYEKQTELSRKLGADLVLTPGDDIVRKAMNFTEGKGVDAVVICVGGDMSSLFAKAVDIARDRAKIILLGRGSIFFDDTIFYGKELTILASRAYGPGRYDLTYEIEGFDYPIGYVKWTENRNMKEILHLISEKKLQLKPLVTHEFTIDEASKAYETIAQEKGNAIGVLLKY